MGILSLFRSRPAPAEQAGSHALLLPRSEAAFFDLTDPALLAYLQDGRTTTSGIHVSVDRAMRNPTVFRCVTLISQSIGMLPLHLIRKADKEKAVDHPLFRVLHRRPNAWQTAYEFRVLMQTWALVHGDAYARKVTSRDLGRARRKVVALIPLDPTRVRVEQNRDFTLTYRYQPPTGAEERIPQDDMFHLRGASLNGLCGLSLVRQAADAIGLALAADLALGRLYKRGSFVNGVLQSKKRMSRPTLESLKQQWESLYSGADAAGGTPVLDDEVEYKPLGPSARDAQSHETRGRQIEEILRIFGVPRPLAMVDDTSWGSGIEQLGKFFVDYALAPWFSNWEQAIERDCLSDDEADLLEIKFNAGALLRGSIKDQGDFFAKALGAGGQRPFMTANEVRERLDMPRSTSPGADDLTNPMTEPASDPASEGGNPGLTGTNDNAR